jgi:adenosine deaminase
MELLELARPFKEFIRGVGLDSKEAGNPPIKFMEFFRQAKKEGYHLTAHCDCDQKESIRNIGQCMDLLEVERIDHGVNVVEDEKLMKTALEKDICFTMCTTWRQSDPEPRRLKRTRQMFELGLNVTINTDNPCEFDSGYLTRTLIGVQQHSGYTALEMVEYMRRAFRGSWLDEQDKKKFIKELNDYAIDYGVIPTL